ncbi:MAG: MBL fold metallo-hydrolase, partial [Gammaproteobacteria bacterium]
SVGSGSSGNALLVQSDTSCLMIDCGFGPRELARRLASRGLHPRDIQAILVTHEHSDHVGGVAAVSARFGIPVLASAGTARAARLAPETLRVLESERPVTVGNIEALPVTVPHDAREPCQFVLSHRGRRLGVLTDLGHVSKLVRERFDRCEALVLECNHDETMLAEGPYPPALKRRIGGVLGHLSNAQAAQFLASVEQGALQHLVAAHLSEQNNSPEKARAAMAQALVHDRGLRLADQDSGFDWIEIA